jgi:hypothetical protein
MSFMICEPHRTTQIRSASRKALVSDVTTA